MRAIVIGLGSMGKRRVRCLQALGVTEIVGVDPKRERREEVQSKYGVFSEAEANVAWSKFGPDIAVISLPPKLHVMAMADCVHRKVPFFVEASVVDSGLNDIISAVKSAGILAAPSTTLHFHPAIREIFQIVRSGRLGKLSNILLHSGQYLPDWHTYEKVSDYYVSDPETGGAREIVPFEMTWFTELFGFPKRVAAQYRKTIDIPGADCIDDTYNCLLDYGDFLANVVVDVVSRNATRRLMINGSAGQLIWSWDDPAIKVFDGDNGVWINVPYPIAEPEAGYNKNIGEKMYVDEMKSFLDAVCGKSTFPNSLEQDHKVLKLLYSLEQSDQHSTFIEI